MSTFWRELFLYQNETCCGQWWSWRLDLTPRHLASVPSLYIFLLFISVTDYHFKGHDSASAVPTAVLLHHSRAYSPEITWVSSILMTLLMDCDRRQGRDWARQTNTYEPGRCLCQEDVERWQICLVFCLLIFFFYKTLRDCGHGQHVVSISPGTRNWVCHSRTVVW